MTPHRARAAGPSAAGTTLLLLAGCAAMVFAASPLDARQRVYSRAELERAVPDTALLGALVRLGDGRAETIGRGTAAIRIDLGQALGAPSGAVAERVPERERLPIGQEADTALGRRPSAQLSLAFRYVVPTEDDGALLALRPVYQARRSLRYDPESRVFRGSFFLTLQDTVQPDQSRDLSAAVRLQLASDEAELMPELVELSHTNLPFHEVEVVTRRVGDALPLRIIPDFDLSGVEVSLPAEPTLTADGGTTQIAGFGVQTGLLTVAVRGGTLERPTTITLIPDRGSVEPNELRLGAGEAATVRLRSAGVGTATVRAFSPQLADAQTTVEFRWPLLFVLAALLGGACGGLGLALYHRRGGGGPPVRQDALLGTVSGLLVATVYYAVGVNLLGIAIDVDYFNEAAVFALAALAGLLGIPLLAAVGGRRRQHGPPLPAQANHEDHKTPAAPR